jgi:class 3 adenylate cyclase
MDALDVRSVLPSVRVPTLVFHRRDNNFIPIERGRSLAEHIPGARFIELPGADLNIFVRTDEVQDEIEEFVTGTRRLVEPDRQLATIMFTDIVGSTERAATLGDRRWKELLARHDQTSTKLIEGANGRLVNTTGDGVLATFDGPGRAIRCAFALGRTLRSDGIEIRIGLHTGEIELREGDDIGGIAVHIAARVMGEAGPGEVVCSRTVKDLVAGSEFAFADRGMHALKGVPDDWQLYAVRTA